VETPLQGQVAVIIGGSGAIGSAICRHFAGAGAACVVTYNSGEKAAKDLVAGLPGKGHWSAHVPVDDSEALTRLAADVEAKQGRADVLVNCAGITRYVPHPQLDDLDDALIDDIFRVNVRGPFAAVRAFRKLPRPCPGAGDPRGLGLAGTRGYGFRERPRQEVA
jgi:3-oxoacyl-[acyl-carrier protein] reductase